MTRVYYLDYDQCATFYIDFTYKYQALSFINMNFSNIKVESMVFDD